MGHVEGSINNPAGFFKKNPKKLRSSLKIDTKVISSWKHCSVQKVLMNT